MYFRLISALVRFVLRVGAQENPSLQAMPQGTVDANTSDGFDRTGLVLVDPVSENAIKRAAMESHERTELLIQLEEARGKERSRLKGASTAQHIQLLRAYACALIAIIVAVIITLHAIRGLRFHLPPIATLGLSTWAIAILSAASAFVTSRKLLKKRRSWGTTENPPEGRAGVDRDRADAP